MARHTGGWVKLWRSLDEHPVAADLESLGLFCWLVMKANRKPSRAKFNGKLIEVKPGQLITAVAEITSRFEITSRQLVRRRLEWLRECQAIDQLVTHHGRLITILNWSKYQESDDGERTTNVTPMESQRPTSGQPTADQWTLSGEVEKLRREEDKEVSATRVPAHTRVDPPHPPTHEIEGSLSPEGLVSLWNANCGELPKTVGTPGRLTKAAEALALHPEEAFWVKAITSLASSDFALGKKPGRDGTFWVGANFDWIVKAGNAQEAEAGTYTDRGKKEAKTIPSALPGCSVCGGRGWVLCFRNDEEAHFGCPVCPWPPKTLAPLNCRDQRFGVDADDRGWAIRTTEARHG